MKPILFNTEMVRAILEGRKTQTRRVVKNTFDHVFEKFTNGVWPFYRNNQSHLVRRECPYGKVGDVLWVRETWVKNLNPNSDDFGKYEFKSDYNWTHAIDLIRWKPSIHMPFEAARIFLEITNVRVERLYDISALDAINEGIEYLGTGYYGPEWKCYFDAKHDTPSYVIPFNSFMSLWVSINGENSWNANPWVWVVEFKRIEKP